MDLSKAFDTLNHGLSNAKREAYGCSAKSLSNINSYLNKGLENANVNCHFSPCKDVLSGVPQGSILDPLLFNIHINDEALLSNYAGDTALYSV